MTFFATFFSVKVSKSSWLFLKDFDEKMFFFWRAVLSHNFYPLALKLSLKKLMYFVLFSNATVLFHFRPLDMWATGVSGGMGGLGPTAYDPNYQYYATADPLDPMMVPSKYKMSRKKIKRSLP